MLCARCNSIHFRRRDDDDKQLYSQHHDTLSALQSSAASCHLCKKILNGLRSELKRQYTVKSLDKQSSVHLSVVLRDSTVADICSHKKWLGSRDVHVHCSGLATVFVTSGHEAGSIQTYIDKHSFGSQKEDNDTLCPTSNVDLARVWLQHCLDNHIPCQNLTRVDPMPFRIIDISHPGKPFLSKGFGLFEKYVTLSYKWGSTAKYVTNSPNISDHQQALPMDKLPRTFIDAIRIAHALGFKFLWIDALCIQDDNPEEKREQIASMGQIYRSSTLTLFAAAGDDSNHGLGTHRDASITRPSVVPCEISVRNWHYKGQLNIVGSNVMSDEYFRISPLVRRAWVLQEEVLSVRGLWFAEDSMSWVCLCESATESVPLLSKIEQIRPQKLNAHHSELDQMMRIRYKLREGYEQWVERDGRSSLEREHVADEWYRLVENFTARELTYAEDALPALSGIASTISKMHELHFVAGLWLEDIQLGLCWEAGGISTQSLDDTTLNRQASRVEQLSGESLKRTPSWRREEEQPNPKRQKHDEPAVADTVYDLTSTCNASFSWISHFLSGLPVQFDLDYSLDYATHLGIQILHTTVSRTPTQMKEFGPFRTASLTARARVKAARVLLDASRLNPQDPYPLVDVEVEDDDERFSLERVGNFHPDDHENVASLGGVIHCVLCAVAWRDRRGSQTYDDNAMVGIAVVSVPGVAEGGRERFRRVGLVRITRPAWFSGCTEKDWDENLDVKEFELV